MSSNKSELFPCPKCGTGRGQAEASCPNCGWNPNPLPATPTRIAPTKTKSHSSGHRTFGIVAIIIGVPLTLSGLMFLLTSTMIRTPDLPFSVTIAPLVQIAMGLLAVLSGFLSMHENNLSKWLFIFSIVGVILNMVYLFCTFVPFIQSY